MPPPDGELFADRYLVERQIGRGGMGVVFAARHPILDQSVAIKLLQADISDDDSHRRRFVNEAKASALIENEHVVRVLDIATLANGQPYIVMEHLEGHDLAQLLRQRKRIPYREAVGYVMQALVAISAAHLQSIIHRDLKPSNLFLADRRDRSRIIKVLDFGISKLMAPPPPPPPQMAKLGARAAGAGTRDAIIISSAGSVTTTDDLLGSPGYISPEQARSTKAVDPRTDIWSIGIILFELITGARPFTGANVGQVIVNVLENDVPPMTTIANDVPKELESIIRKCLEKKAESRFANVHTLAQALAPFGDATAATSLSRIEAMTTPAAPAAPAAAAASDGRLAVANASATVAPPQRRSSSSRGGIVLGVVLGAVITAVSTLAVAAWCKEPPAVPSPPSPSAAPSPAIASVASAPIAVAPESPSAESAVALAPAPRPVVRVSKPAAVVPAPRTADPITRVRTE